MGLIEIARKRKGKQKSIEDQCQDEKEELDELFRFEESFQVTHLPEASSDQDQQLSD